MRYQPVPADQRQRNATVRQVMPNVAVPPDVQRVRLEMTAGCFLCGNGRAPCRHNRPML